MCVEFMPYRDSAAQSGGTILRVRVGSAAQIGRHRVRVGSAARMGRHRVRHRVRVGSAAQMGRHGVRRGVRVGSRVVSSCG